jgi:diguanylate cyclase (GGDEF)-like protein
LCRALDRGVGYEQGQAGKAQAASHRSTVDIALSKPKTVSVLLLEDDRDYALLVRDLLQHAGDTDFSVTHVESLAAARRALAGSAPDCVLADLTLPDADWLEAPAELQSLAPGVPIVILSGIADESIAMKAMHRGAQDYLVKGHIDAHLLGRSIHYAIERKQAEAEALDEAVYDSLTGLPNRGVFVQKLGHALERRGRKSPHVTVVFITVEDLELINSSLGRPVGKELMRAVGDRLRAVLPEPAAIACVGPGLFALLSEHLSSGLYRARAMERIRTSLDKPFILENETVYVSARIDVVVAEPHEDDPEAVIRRAEVASREKEEQAARWRKRLRARAPRSSA